MCVRFTTHHWLFLNPTGISKDRRDVEWNGLREDIVR